MINQLVFLLAVHWLADFVFQTRWQATNKSRSNVALTSHVVWYTVFLCGGAYAIFGMRPMVAWCVLINGMFHWVTDWFTSRASSYFYAKEDWHKFFVVIGFDQFCHQAILLATFGSIPNV